MRTLVVGLGSIGMRHARILGEQGCEVAVVSRRGETDLPRFETVASAVERHQPSYVVIANRTCDHRRALLDLVDCRFDGLVLVEKPLFDTVHTLPSHRFAGLFVGYNLRLHPGLQRLRSLIADERVVSAQVYAGQFLPDWRPSRDYRGVYSADRAQGGGVLRDLSHELDYLLWLFGRWIAVAAIGGRLSALEVESDDTIVATIAFRGCPAAAVQLNYLDRAGRRTLVVNSEQRTVELDFVAGRLSACPSPAADPEQFEVERDETYRQQHVAVLAGRTDDLCTAEEALDVLRLIAAIERSVAEQTWVTQ